MKTFTCRIATRQYFLLTFIFSITYICSSCNYFNNPKTINNNVLTKPVFIKNESTIDQVEEQFEPTGNFLSRRNRAYTVEYKLKSNNSVMMNCTYSLKNGTWVVRDYEYYDK